MANVKFCAGCEIGQADDEKVISWNESEKSQHEIMKDALLWAAGRFPASDCDYEASVWIEDEDGEVLDSEAVSISADGEMNFPE